MTVYTDALPEKLPPSGPITDAAQDIRDTATKSTAAVDDAQNQMNGLPTVFDTPDTEVAVSAIRQNIRPMVADITVSIGPVTTGLDTFASDLDSLRQRYDRVREDVAEHNDWVRPSDENPNQAEYDRQERALAREVETVARLYDEAVERCENKVNQGSPLTMPESPIGPAVSFGIGLSLSSIQAWNDSHVKFVKVRNGKINIVTKSPVRRSTLKISGGVMKKLGIPDSYVQRYMKVFDANGKSLSIGDWDRAIRDVDPKSPLGKVFAAHPWLKNRFKQAHARVTVNSGNAKGPVASSRIIAQDGRGIHPSAHGSNRNKTLPHPDAEERGKWGTRAKWAGRAFTVFGFASSFSNGYNSSVERNPDGTGWDHAGAAVADATIETAAGAVGGHVGAMAGRAGGAAIGQVLIPIPGVGAAIGGVVGGVVGGAIGGWLGGAIGGGINAARHSEDDSVGGRVSSFLGGMKKGLFG